MDDLAGVGEERPLEDLVLEVELERAFLDQEQHQRLDVPGVEGGGVRGMVAGRFEWPMIVTRCLTTSSPATESSQLPPCSTAMSTITAPGRMTRPWRR